ncbi:DUF1758 domain-containing protein [Trichonephila inaurata madagascariensis]|uniref:DUF1758 domain-containing protein n=1 Tax=Trichonephila inaurata madagascariensis TaxID=2747483 RepID=A0A8X7CLR7_9ARAC|nr:DUF1758 domain-containing protein [Trichonephila inaurata madagascariensis]
MELVPKHDYAKREAYYLPHHAVLRDSSTTKLRVVFDASAKSTTGHSLNDLLMVGPRVQRDVSHRKIPIGNEFYGDNPKELVKEYRLTTVTYGTSCAPYFSTRTLTQLALDERERYPLASFATLDHFYVDDLLSGAATEKKAVELGFDYNSQVLLCTALVNVCDSFGGTQLCRVLLDPMAREVRLA